MCEMCAHAQREVAASQLDSVPSTPAFVELSHTHTLGSRENKGRRGTETKTVEEKRRKKRWRRRKETREGRVRDEGTKRLN